MSDNLPAKKQSFTLTQNAIAQAKAHNITKEAVLNVMGNKAGAKRLDNGHIQFAGSSLHPQTFITAQFVPEKRLWVINDVRIIEPEIEQEAPAAPDKTGTTEDQPDESPLPVILTKHARNVLKSEFMDARVVEQIIHNPTEQREEDDEKVRFIGWAHGDKLHVIAKLLPEEQKWLVITVEVRFEAAPQADVSEFDSAPTSEHPGIRFTTHALERMELRNISPYEVQQTIQDPESTVEDEDEKVKFIGKKLTQNRAYHAVCKFIPEENTWQVISVWVRGEEDDGSLSTRQPRSAPAANNNQRVAFTNKAREWMQRENIDSSDLESIVLNPTKKQTQQDGKVKFTGIASGQALTIHVIGKHLPEEDKWLVITAWMPRSGKHKSRKPRQTYRKTYRNGSHNNRSVVRWIILLIVIAVGLSALLARIFPGLPGF